MRSLNSYVLSALALLVLLPQVALADAWDDAQVSFAELDDRTAIRHLRQGAASGDTRAQHSLGLALIHAERLFPGVLAANETEGVKWLAKAAAATAAHSPAAEKRTTLGRYLSPAEAQALKRSGGRSVLFLDVRTRAEAIYVGMPDSVDALIPYLEHDDPMSDWDSKRHTFRVNSNPHFADDVARALDARALDRDATIVLICRSGTRSARATDLLASLGYRHVYSIPEGFEGDLSNNGHRDLNGWKNEGLSWTYRLDPDKVLFPRH